MKSFKKVDVLLQAAIICFSVLLALLNTSKYIFLAYFLTGGYQFLSAFIHLFNGQAYYPVKGRRYYWWTLVVIIVVIVVITAISFEYFILVGLALLWISPALAIWYLFICYRENRLLAYKEMVHLK